MPLAWRVYFGRLSRRSTSFHIFVSKYKNKVFSESGLHTFKKRKFILSDLPLNTAIFNSCKPKLRLIIPWESDTPVGCSLPFLRYVLSKKFNVLTYISNETENIQYKPHFLPIDEMDLNNSDPVIHICPTEKSNSYYLDNPDCNREVLFLDYKQIEKQSQAISEPQANNKIKFFLENENIEFELENLKYIVAILDLTNKKLVKWSGR